MESNELLSKLLKGLMVVYQISLSQWLWKDIFLTFCYLGLEFCRGHWWGVCQPWCLSSKVFQNSVRISVIGELQQYVCHSRLLASMIWTRQGIVEGGWVLFSCNICCLSLVWSLPMCVYFPCDSWCWFYSPFREMSGCLKVLPFHLY